MDNHTEELLSNMHKCVTLNHDRIINNDKIIDVIKKLIDALDAKIDIVAQRVTHLSDKLHGSDMWLHRAKCRAEEVAKHRKIIDELHTTIELLRSKEE